jgi:hypothetical protein
VAKAIITHGGHSDRVEPPSFRLQLLSPWRVPKQTACWRRSTPLPRRPRPRGDPRCVWVKAARWRRRAQPEDRMPKSVRTEADRTIAKVASWLCCKRGRPSRASLRSSCWSVTASAESCTERHAGSPALLGSRTSQGAFKETPATDRPCHPE